MDFKNRKFKLLVRLTILLATMFLFVDLFYSGSYTLSKILVFLLITLQVIYLYLSLEKSNHEIVGFLKTIQYEDFTHTYPNPKSGTSLDTLYHEFNEVIRKFREIRADKEAQYQYLKTIVQHVGIGIVTFDKKGEIQIMNASARRLLGVGPLKNINQLQTISEELIRSVNELRTGGRDLIKITRDGEDSQIAIYAIELSLRGKDFKLISLQNIQSELEEKEMEAWQNLIRVLTHEIMNSVTPISSLAATVEGDLDDFLKKEGSISFEKETLEEYHLAVKTIHNRSDSLIKFVSDFRNMTRIKHPNLEETPIAELLEHVISLLKNEMDDKQIELKVTIVPADLTVLIDKEQIEQVLINLMKNAIEALAENEEDGKSSKQLNLKAWKSESEGAYVSIADNGTGIDEEALKKIFIPFFTTKKHGSGIGLSLSKQIMRHHRGTISVKSALNAGTEFTLKFSQ